MHCDIGRGIVDVFGSMCACVVVIYISKMVEIKFRIAGKFLAFFGRYSLLVLCVHIIELDLFPWWMITGRFEGMGDIWKRPAVVCYCRKACGRSGLCLYYFQSTDSQKSVWL